MFLFWAPRIKMSLKNAMDIAFNLNLLPQDFAVGCAMIAAVRRLNIDSVILALIVGTASFIGKSEVSKENSKRVDVGSLWVVNVQVKY